MFGIGMGRMGAAGGASLESQVAAIYASGLDGAWYDGSSLATLSQDSAGTTPVTAADQPIGRAEDKSGRGNHVVQATAASRPLYQANGSALFDGSNDSWSSASGGGGTAGFFFCAAINIAGGAGTTRGLLGDFGVNTGYWARIDSSNSLGMRVGNGSANSFLSTGANTAAVGSTIVVMGWDDGVNLYTQVNTGAVAQIARPAVAAGSAGFTIGKDNTAVGAFSNVSVFASVYVKNSGLTAAQRAQVQAYCRSQAGL